MPRPKRCRRVCCDPRHRYFKPQGIPLTQLERVDLGLDELEALRLADVDGMAQAEAADRMGVSQPTFNRILNSARGKVSRAVAEGKALRIESPGENVQIAGQPRRRSHRHRGRGIGGERR